MYVVYNETQQWRKVVMEHFWISYGMEERQKTKLSPMSARIRDGEQGKETARRAS
jgi:hypothetical protein